MRPTRALWAFLIFVFVGAALVSPWVYFALAKAGWGAIPFRKVENRLLIALALLALWPFVRSLGVKNAGEIGLRKDVPIGRHLAKGLAIGIGLLLLGAMGSMLAGASVMDHLRTSAAWPKQIAGAAATAVIVAFLEEILFRGAIFTAFRKTWNDAAGLWGSSAIYGILHFLARPENPAEIHWYSGFIVLGSMLSGFTDFQTVVPGFFSITLLGVILALAFKRTGALYLSMGIHAGVIFGVKLFGFATNAAPGANRWFWGTEKLVDGWFCFILLALATIWFARSKKASGA